MKIHLARCITFLARHHQLFFFAFMVIAIPVARAASPVIYSPSVVTAEIQADFQYAILATNSPTSYYSSTNLPQGLSLDSGTGIITGQPLTVGAFAVTLVATNNDSQIEGIVPFTLNLQVYDPQANPPYFADATLAGGTAKWVAGGTAKWVPLVDSRIVYQCGAEVNRGFSRVFRRHFAR